MRTIGNKFTRMGVFLSLSICLTSGRPLLGISDPIAVTEAVEPTSNLLTTTNTDGDASGGTATESALSSSGVAATDQTTALATDATTGISTETLNVIPSEDGSTSAISGVTSSLPVSDTGPLDQNTALDPIPDTEALTYAPLLLTSLPSTLGYVLSTTIGSIPDYSDDIPLFNDIPVLVYAPVRGNTFNVL